MDGAQQLKVVCVSQSDGQREDAVLAKTSLQVWGQVSPFTFLLDDLVDLLLQLDPKTLNERWRRQTLGLGQVKLAVSLKYRPHLVGPPSLTCPGQLVFGVHLEAVAR